MAAETNSSIDEATIKAINETLAPYGLTAEVSGSREYVWITNVYRNCYISVDGNGLRQFIKGGSELSIAEAEAIAESVRKFL